jgi:hypothetical protein
MQYRLDLLLKSCTIDSACHESEKLGEESDDRMGLQSALNYPRRKEKKSMAHVVSSSLEGFRGQLQEAMSQNAYMHITPAYEYYSVQSTPST